MRVWLRFAPVAATSTHVPVARSARPSRTPRATAGTHGTAGKLLALQASAGNRAVSAALGGRPTVQRHASDEHLALGEVPPKKLAGIAEARDLHKVLSSSGKFKLGDESDPDQVIRKAIHLLQSERERVRDWQATGGTPGTAGVHGKVRVVNVSCSDGSVLATYGELNTLPDYVGSVKDLQSLSKKHLHQILQTLRQEYYEWLGKFLLELTAHDYVEKWVTEVVPAGPGGQVTTIQVKKKFYRPEGNAAETPADQSKVRNAAEYTVQEGGRLKNQPFKDSQKGFKAGDLLSPKASLSSYFGGMAGASVPVDLDAGAKARKTGGAWGSLARNACHFAPFSWQAWAEHHREAMDLATEAHDLKPTDPGEAAKKEAQAFTVNGFGDHYLQDSFAAGHLMNKTLVMQWFTDYVRENWKVFGPGGATERRLEKIADQSGIAGKHLYDKDANAPAMDPQAVANKGEKSGRAAMFQLSGLEVPRLRFEPTAEAVILSMMQTANSRTAWFTASELAERTSRPEFMVKASLEELEGHALVEKEAKFKYFGEMTYRLSLSDTLATQLKAMDKRKQAVDATSVTNPIGSMVMSNYEEWLFSSTVQLGSKVLHDYFCKKGLEVEDGENKRVYKIYGDYNLLEANSAEGVKRAAETSQLSQQDVQERVSQGSVSPDRTATIHKRFPARAKTPTVIEAKSGPIPVPNGGQMLRIDQFMTDLKPQLTQLFGSELLFKEWMGSRTLARSPTKAGTMMPHEGEPF